MPNNNEVIKMENVDFPEYDEIRKTILEAREKVVTTVNTTMVATYWTVGKKLYEVQSQTDSTYGKKLIIYSSKKLTEEFGKGFDERNLRNMRQFYKTFQKWNTVCSELSWSHYRLLMRIKEEEKREYYIKECVECAWGVSVIAHLN